MNITSNTAVYDLSVEYKSCPLGVDTDSPRFGWKLTSDLRGESQTAYELTVALDARLKNVVWRSGRVENDISYGIEYAGEPLESATRYYWSVTVYNNAGTPIVSPVSFFETALLSDSDWAARRIGINGAESAEMLRRRFTIAKSVKSARLYATALGLYIASINGQPVCSDYLAPGWTDYDKRVQYQVYDVTELLQEGDNAIGVILGNGWFSGHFSCCNNYYGKAPSFFGQLAITYTDGSREIIASDRRWRGYGSGAYIADDLQNGVTYDARKELRGWDTAAFDDSLWIDVNELSWVSDITNEPFGKLCAQPSAPIRAIERITPVAVNKIGDSFVVDMGQNFAGVAELRIPECESGTEIRLRFGELITKNGNVDMGNLGSAEQTDCYISNGAASVFSPQFTYHGYQYVEVSGYPAELTANDITGIVISTDIPYCGSFICSDEDVNKIISNTRYSQLSNFTSVPTDCPQRSERSGWLGDIRIFGAAAAFNADINQYITKYLHDVYDAANPKTGAMPDVAPKTTRYEGSLEGHTAWGDAGVALPWLLYTVYGDKRILEESYEYCKRWIEYYLNNSENYIYIPTKGEYNDWLNCNEGTPGDLVGTAYFKYSADLMANIAHTLERHEDEEFYSDLSCRIFDAFAERFVTQSGYYAGRVGNDSEASYILALGFDLVPDSIYAKVEARHLHLLKSRGFRPYNGYSSVNLLLPWLSEAGYTDYAYDCLFNRRLPGWLWFVKAGLTTMPESWWGTPSRNHYVFGCVCEWMYRYVAGIDSGDRVAYKHIHFHPTFDKKNRLTFVNAKTESVFGPIESSWSLNTDSTYTYRVSIPANTTATVTFPTPYAYVDGKPISNGDGICNVNSALGELSCDIESGSYEFSLSFSASDAAKRVEEAISAIGRITDLNESSGDAISSAAAAYDRLSIFDKLAVGNSVDMYLAAMEYENIADDIESGLDDDLRRAAFCARVIDRLPEVYEITGEDAAQISEAAAVYDLLSDEAKEQVYNADVLMLSLVVINNLPNPYGTEHILELVSPEGPEGGYYALKTGERIYAGDSIRIDTSKPIVYGDYIGTVLNFSKLNNWNDIYDRELCVRVDERDKVEVWCMTLALNGGAKDIVIKLGEFEVLVPHVAADIIAAIEVAEAIAALDEAESSIEYYRSDIEPVRRAYDKLHKDVRYLVENISKLDKLERLFMPEVGEAISKDIGNLPKLCSLTLADRAAVAALRERADKLGPRAKELICEYKRLCDSELVLSLYPTPETVKLEVASRVGPESCYLKVPSGITLHNGDMIVVPYGADYTYGDITSTLINMAFDADWQRAWQYDYPMPLKSTGDVGVYCLTMHPGNKNTVFKLVDLTVEVKYTVEDIVAAIDLRDELMLCKLSVDEAKARFDMLHPDVRDKILHI